MLFPLDKGNIVSGMEIIELPPDHPFMSNDPPVKYPWNEWLDGKFRVLKYKEDFKCTPETLRSAAYQAARKRGLKIKVRLGGVQIENQWGGLVWSQVFLRAKVDFPVTDPGEAPTVADEAITPTP